VSGGKPSSQEFTHPLSARDGRCRKTFPATEVGEVTASAAEKLGVLSIENPRYSHPCFRRPCQKNKWLRGDIDSHRISGGSRADAGMISYVFYSHV